LGEGLRVEGGLEVAEGQRVVEKGDVFEFRVGVILITGNGGEE
jgi:hypothetical protein